MYVAGAQSPAILFKVFRAANHNGFWAAEFRYMIGMVRPIGSPDPALELVGSAGLKLDFFLNNTAISRFFGESQHGN